MRSTRSILKNVHPNENALDLLCLLYGWTKIARGPLRPPDNHIDPVVGTIMLEKTPEGPFLHLMWSDPLETWIKRFKEAEQ